MHTILVPFDGSENALRAVEEAVSLFQKKNLHVRLLNVQEPIHGGEVLLKDTLHELRVIEKDREHAGLAILEPARSLLETAGVSFDAHARIGKPAETIVSFAREFHCDMVVMGTRGEGAIKKLVMGSVASKVVNLASVAVLLVK